MTMLAPVARRFFERIHRTRLAEQASRAEDLMDALDRARIVRSHGTPRTDPHRQQVMAALWDVFEISVHDILDEVGVVKKVDMD